MALALAASLVVSGVDRMIGLGWISLGMAHVWDSSDLLDDRSRFGSIVAALTGYCTYPAMTNIIAYLGFWSFVGALFYRQQQFTLKQVQSENT